MGVILGYRHVGLPSRCGLGSQPCGLSPPARCATTRTHPSSTLQSSASSDAAAATFPTDFGPGQRGHSSSSATERERQTSNAPPPPDIPPQSTQRPKQGRGRPRLRATGEAKAPIKRPAAAPSQDQSHTELIVKLERRGDGWGEEFIPSIKVERRPIESLSSVRQRAAAETSAQAAADEDASLESSESSLSGGSRTAGDGFAYLVDVGVPEEEVEDLVHWAVSWRVTPEGRALLDRRRQSRLARNVKLVAEHLNRECGVPYGPEGIGAVFRQCPDLMLCKPTSNDRWDRRAVELAAFRLSYGHCNVPEAWEPNPELSVWVKRQRVARASGQLSAERMQVLERLGFEFGDLAHITEHWEQRFDQLIDWMLWHGENGQVFSWVGIDWGERGGVTAREVALWMTLQKEFRRRQLLPDEAEQRFEAIGVQWEPAPEHAAEDRWMGMLGRLLYVVEKRCLELRGVLLKPKRVQPLKRKGNNAVAATAADVGSFTADGDYDAHVFSDESEDGAMDGGAANGNGRMAGAARAGARSRAERDVVFRKEAFVSVSLKEEPGLSWWLAKQRWLWRQGRLTAEQVRMLHATGVDMDVYSPTEWQVMSHTAAALLNGSRVTLGVAENVVAYASAAASETANPALPAAAAPGSVRLRVKRWVQTQQALFAEGRLSPGQLRYLTFLGITWVLSDAVIHMGDREWSRLLEALAALKGSGVESGGADHQEQQQPASDGAGSGAALSAQSHPRIMEWLNHQRGLRAVGLLSTSREAALTALEVGWSFKRGDVDDEWDIRLSQLLVHSAEGRGLEINRGNELFGGLAEWLEARRVEMAENRLPRGRMTQLKALGVMPLTRPCEVTNIVA
jgi:hypothetical protein